MLMEETKARLKSYLDRVGLVLGHAARAKHFAIYVCGLIARLERKNGETIAAAAIEATGDPISKTNSMYQRLLHVVGESDWDDESVRAAAERYAIESLPAQEKVEQLIIDDTGWLKQGKHSVGVQRQYTGTAGKITNCQVGVSVVAATATNQVPLDFALYLPEQWLTVAMRAKGKIPRDVIFQTKTDIALGLLDRVQLRGLVPSCRVSADSAYGNSSKFRCELLEQGYELAVGVRGDTRAWSVDCAGNRRGPLTDITAISVRMKYKRVSWREGTKGSLAGRFAARRIVPYRDFKDYDRADSLWLLAEQDSPETGRDKFAFITAQPHTTLKDLVLIWKERYRTERAYQDLKESCGLDHYQGRFYKGWNHHVSAVLVAAAFLFSEQCRDHHPRPKGRQEAVRSYLRLDRHFPSSLATLQRTLACVLEDWIPNFSLDQSQLPVLSM